MTSTAPLFPPRHAVSRAYFFLDLAERCDTHTRDHCEAFMEAAIVFARTAIHRLRTQFHRHPEWKPWFESLLGDASVMFFRRERDHILKTGPPKVGQIIGGAPQRAAEMYYYETSDIPATVTIRRHVDANRQDRCRGATKIHHHMMPFRPAGASKPEREKFSLLFRG